MCYYMVQCLAVVNKSMPTSHLSRAQTPKSLLRRCEWQLTSACRLDAHLYKRIAKFTQWSSLKEKSLICDFKTPTQKYLWKNWDLGIESLFNNSYWISMIRKLILKKVSNKILCRNGPTYSWFIDGLACSLLHQI